MAFSATAKAIDSLITANVGCFHDSAELLSFNGVLLAVGRLVAKLTTVVTNYRLLLLHSITIAPSATTVTLVL